MFKGFTGLVLPSLALGVLVLTLVGELVQWQGQGRGGSACRGGGERLSQWGSGITNTATIQVHIQSFEMTHHNI